MDIDEKTMRRKQHQQRWCLFRSSMFEFSDYDNVSVTGRQSATSTLNREIDAPNIELAGYLERKKNYGSCKTSKFSFKNFKF